MSRRTDKKKLKRMNESAVSQASVTVATVSTVKADDAAPAAETTAPVSQPSAAYDLYIQYQGADYNAEELASQILEKCKAEGMDSADLKIYVKPEDKKHIMHVQEVTATSSCNPFCNVSERGFIHRNESLQQKIRRANLPGSSLRIFYCISFQISFHIAFYSISYIFIYDSIDSMIHRSFYRYQPGSNAHNVALFSLCRLPFHATPVCDRNHFPLPLE